MVPASGQSEEPVTSVGTVADIESLPPSTEVLLVRRLDDAKAKALARLRQLRVLYQDGSSSDLTDAGVEELIHLPALEVLDLEWAGGITDRGISALRQLHRLRWLDIGGCFQLSEVAIQDLRRALPSLEIEW